MNDNKLTAMDEARSRFVKLSMADPDEIPALNAELQLWLAQSQSHRDAYGSVLNLHAEGMVSKGSATYGHQSEHYRRHSDEEQIHKASPWARYGAIAAVLVSVLTAGLVYRSATVGDEQTPIVSAQYQPLTTVRGEIREFRLADGSIATLDTDSRIEVSMTKQVRLLRLSQGRARLNVANDDRPFRVEAGFGEIVTQAAKLDIQYQDSQSFNVQLISGDALVRPAPQYASFKIKSQPLVVGQLTSLGSKDFQIKPVGNQNDTRDWPGGWIESRSIRLDALVAMANNYADQPIKLESADLAGLQVSGRFKISDTKGFVARICDLFDLSARSETSGIYLRKR